MPAALVIAEWKECWRGRNSWSEQPLREEAFEVARYLSSEILAVRVGVRVRTVAPGEISFQNLCHHPLIDFKDPSKMIGS